MPLRYQYIPKLQESDEKLANEGGHIMTFETVTFTGLMVIALLVFLFSIISVVSISKFVKEADKLPKESLKLDYAKWVTREFSISNEINVDQVLKKIDKMTKYLFYTFALVTGISLVCFLIVGGLAGIGVAVIFLPMSIIFFSVVALLWRFYQAFTWRYAKFKEIALHEHYIALKLLQDRDNLQ